MGEVGCWMGLMDENGGKGERVYDSFIVMHILNIYERLMTDGVICTNYITYVNFSEISLSRQCTTFHSEIVTVSLFEI